MSIKWIGAMLIIAACGGFGFSLAAAHRKDEQAMRQLISALDYMECELQYHLTALPELCRQAGSQCTGALQKLFIALSQELEDQVTPEVSSCMLAALSRSPELPKRTSTALKCLGRSLGRFDLEGQLRGLESLRQSCRKEMDALEKGREERLRSYQTLGLCAGAALALLFL